MFSQEAPLIIKGKVFADDQSIPLVGASVSVKGTERGTFTDSVGNYTVLCFENDTLIFSYIGFITQEVAVTESETIDIRLIHETELLKDVVVIGYGTINKSQTTGAVSKLNVSTIENRPVTRVDLAMNGAVPGITVQQTDATVGEAPVIRVRGTGSISASADPLIVIDGIPVDNTFFDIVASEEIASIEVLKDAASAAIYGSRGANGVILISTKNGTADKNNITFNTYFGSKWINKRSDLYPSVKDWLSEANSSTVLDSLGNSKLQSIELLGTETNWQDVIFDAGNVTNYSISSSGGDEKRSYFFSGNYLHDNGAIISSGFKKYSGRINIKNTINNFIDIGAFITPYYSTQEILPIELHDALRSQPWLPVYHDENTLSFIEENNVYQIGDYAHERHFGSIRNSSNNNGYSRVFEATKQYNTFKAIGKAYLQVKPFKGAKVHVSIGGNYLNKEYSFFESSESNRNFRTSGQNAVEKKSHWVNENLFTYTFSNQSHQFNGVAGFTTEKFVTDYISLSGGNYLTNEIPTLNASIITGGTGLRSVSTMVSGITRINYFYNNTYSFSLSNRVDASSKFGPNNRTAFFPALSMGWLIHKEQFLQELPVVSYLKLRGSYGRTGNIAGIGDYAYAGLVHPVSAVADGTKTQGFNVTNLTNSELKWERALEFSSALEAGIFKNRFMVVLEYYNRLSDQLLLNLEIPSAIGYNAYLTNIGKVRNDGYEIELHLHNINTPNVSWSSEVSFSSNTNTVLDLGGPEYIPTVVDANKRPTEFRAVVDGNICAYYAYVTEKEIPREHLISPYYPINVNANDVYVKDLNDDGIINSDDRTIVGSPFPDFVFGISNSVRFKNIELSFLFQGSIGGEIMNIDPYYYETHWNGDDYTGEVDTERIRAKYETDYMIQDASFLSLRNINLSYTFSEEVCQKLKIKGLSIYSSAENIMYIMADTYTSFNPEGINRFNENPLTFGYQRGAMPVQRSAVVGVEFKL